MPVVSSTPSSSSSVTITTTSWWLKCPETPSLNTTIVVLDWKPKRAAPAAVFNPVRTNGVDNPRSVVLRGPKLGVQATLGARTLSEAQFNALTAILEASKTMLLQNTLGQQWYVELAGDYDFPQLRATSTPSEVYPTRFAHDWSIPLVEVDVP